METTIPTNLNWSKGEEFLHFAFGNFNSKNAGIIRTSDGSRFNIDLAPPMQDMTAEVPGGDGQYYFGTFHKPKVFNINFAFDDLTKTQLRNLKKAFIGKEMREFCLSEDSDKIYMVKVTSQPSIKALCFDGDDEDIYKGEGSVQFTAYWPYSRNKNPINIIKQSNSSTTTEFNIEYSGDYPAHFVFTKEGSIKIEKIEINSFSISGSEITSWDSKTGIVKSEDNIIPYTGDGLIKLQNGDNIIKITHDDSSSGEFVFTYYNWYY